jgi:hypothetical protein
MLRTRPNRTLALVLGVVSALALLLTACSQSSDEQPSGARLVTPVPIDPTLVAQTAAAGAPPTLVPVGALSPTPAAAEPPTPEPIGATDLAPDAPATGVTSADPDASAALAAAAVVPPAAPEAVVAASPEPIAAQPAFVASPIARAPAPTPPGAPSANRSTALATFVVDNTLGRGMALRPAPTSRIAGKPWPDGTRMEGLGAEQDAYGWTWRWVRDPDGTSGWMPSNYLIQDESAPAPSSGTGSAMAPSAPPTLIIVPTLPPPTVRVPTPTPGAPETAPSSAPATSSSAHATPPSVPTTTIPADAPTSTPGVQMPPTARFGTGLR